MTRIRRINVSQVEGDSANNTSVDEIRPFGETAFYLDGSPPAEKLTLMMFDGVRTHRDSKVLSPGVLWGSNADAGDGSGADTIKLIPDAELFANGSDQYIVVDPTDGEPGHIHIRAGGTQDSSGADLYIGGEQTHVKVSDINDNVVIRTSTLGEGIFPHSWIFDNTGNLTLPASGNIRYGNARLSLNENNGINVYLTTTTDDTTAVFMTTTGIQTYARESVSLYAGTTLNTLETAYNNKVIELDAAFAADSWTGAGYPAGPTSSQALNAAKAMNPLIPDAWITIATGLQTAYDTWQSALGDSGVGITAGSKTWAFTPDGNLTLPNNGVIRVDGNNVEVGGITNFNVETVGVVNVYTDDGAYQWQFGDNGNLTLPGDIVFAGGGYIEDSEAFFVATDGGFQIQTNKTAGQKVWDFGNDGNLTFPDGTNYSGNDITVPSSIPTAISNINSSGSWEQNPTSDLATTGGSGVGLTVSITDFESGYAGTITIDTPGTGYTDGDTITVTSGSASATFTITVPANTWTFGTDGGLTFPDGTVQTTAAAPYGQYDHLIDGTNTPYAVPAVSMSLFNVHPASGYQGSDVHTVIIPIGQPGQRLVITNQSSLCALSIGGAVETPYNIAVSSQAEFVYVAGDYGTGWRALYGTV